VATSELAGQVAPLLATMGLELYDLEVGPGSVRVTVTRDGGVDLDTLAAASTELSAWLDAHDPMPGRYTLEVSSPGLERRLRTPAQFKGALGETVTLRIVRDGVATTRVTGTLATAGDTTVTLATDDGEVEARYDEVERARTVFAWGPAPKPSPSRGRRSHAAREA